MAISRNLTISIPELDTLEDLIKRQQFLTRELRENLRDIENLTAGLELVMTVKPEPEGKEDEQQ